MTELELKMSPVNRDLFRQMLGIKELPENLVRRYFSIKKMTDKVDGRLTPADLARIALDCGYDPELGEFVGFEGTITTGTAPFEKTTETIEEKVDEPEEADKSIKEVLYEKDVRGRTKLEDEEKTEPTADVPESADIGDDEINVGDTVTALVDDEMKEGKIVGSQEKNDEMIYQVEIDGETVDVSEDNIDKA